MEFAAAVAWTAGKYPDRGRNGVNRSDRPVTGSPVLRNRVGTVPDLCLRRYSIRLQGLASAVDDDDDDDDAKHGGGGAAPDEDQGWPGEAVFLRPADAGLFAGHLLRALTSEVRQLPMPSFGSAFEAARLAAT